MFNDVLARKPRRAANLFLWAPLVLMGLVLGLLWPTLTAAGLYAALAKVMPSARRWLLPALAVAYSQAIWIAIGGLVDSAQGLVALGFAAVIGALAFWVQLSQGGRVAIGALTAAQAIFLILTAFGAPVLLAQTGSTGQGMFVGARAIGAGVAMPLVDIILLVLALTYRPKQPLSAIPDTFD